MFELFYLNQWSGVYDPFALWIFIYSQWVFIPFSRISFVLKRVKAVNFFSMIRISGLSIAWFRTILSKYTHTTRPSLQTLGLNLAPSTKTPCVPKALAGSNGGQSLTGWIRWMWMPHCFLQKLYANTSHYQAAKVKLQRIYGNGKIFRTILMRKSETVALNLRNWTYGFSQG